VTTCRSCHAPIVWGYTINGRRMPLDPEPVVGGNLVLVGQKVRGATAEDAHGTRYVSHFSTCPMASAHRRKGAQS
jgi:hypothetical protein